MTSMVRALLAAVHDDIAAGRVTSTNCGSAEEFSRRYDWLLAGREHPTHRTVKLVAQKHSGADHEVVGVVPYSFLSWLRIHDPVICMGDVNGKHDDVEGNFSEFFVESSADYYVVEDFGLDKTPDVLGSEYALWTKLADVFEVWAAERIAAGGLSRLEADEFHQDDPDDWRDFHSVDAYRAYLECAFPEWQRLNSKILLAYKVVSVRASQSGDVNITLDGGTGTIILY